MVEQVNLIIKRGDSWSRTIYFEDEDGNDLDITGWKIYFMVKEEIDDADNAAVISKIATLSNPTAGEATIELTSSDTNLSGNFIFGIKAITDVAIGTTKEAITVLEGTVVFTDRVVQAVS
jgi:hypothetical protein